MMLPLQGVNTFAACMEQECAAGDGNPGSTAGVLTVGAPDGADKPHFEKATKVCLVPC